jgi:hypothetical protein
MSVVGNGQVDTKGSGGQLLELEPSAQCLERVMNLGFERWTDFHGSVTCLAPFPQICGTELIGL